MIKLFYYYSRLDSVVSPTFRLCLEITCKVLSVTKPLSVKLQTMNQDLLQAVRSVDSCMEVLQSMRDGYTYDKLFDLINEETEDGVKLETTETDWQTDTSLESAGQ